ncbi:hypothetical protein [Pseudoalteromonas rubra]|uniref:hypothetical protein n=1 Tax=Pseudoalteromonas rubra TaxID=43658 RepID=UPI000F7B3804|nr:hypothetical protein [Pseudoalteromonas rubra]
MKKVVLLTSAIVLISGCASTEMKLESENDLSSFAVASAKNNTNIIGKLRLDGRVKKQYYDKYGVELAHFWFVGFKWDVDNFQDDIVKFCTENNGDFNLYDVNGNLRITYARLGRFLLTESKDQRQMLFECVDRSSSQIRYSMALNKGDADSSAGGDVIKARVATFENQSSLSDTEFRNQYVYIAEQLNNKWINDY